MATCDECDRPLCLACAVPVRGRVLGQECLSSVLGEDAAVPDAPPAPRRVGAGWLVGLGFLVAVVGSALPWTRFSVGSGLLGGWGFSPPRWSLLASGAALLGLACWAAWTFRGPRPGRWMRLVLAAMAILVAAGAVLHILHPPPFTHPAVGPWVALAGGVIALLSAPFARSAPGPRS